MDCNFIATLLETLLGLAIMLKWVCLEYVAPNVLGVRLNYTQKTIAYTRHGSHSTKHVMQLEIYDIIPGPGSSEKNFQNILYSHCLILQTV